MFLLHRFWSRLSKQVISISIKKRFRNIWGVRKSENRFTSPKTSTSGFLSLGKCVSPQPTLTWKHCDRFPCTDRLRILRWTGHQAFSYRVIHLLSFCTCSSLLEVQWWSQQSTKLFVIEVRFRWRRDASRWDIGWRYDRLVQGQGSDTILNPSEADILLDINDLVVNDRVRLITCGKKFRRTLLRT